MSEPKHGPKGGPSLENGTPMPLDQSEYDHCAICTEPCAKPPPGEPPVCDGEWCRREAWRQLHPEDGYVL